MSPPQAATPKRARCEGCERPLAVCVCAHVKPLHTRTRVLILQHPRERHVPINTARLARLSLPDAMLRRGVELDADPVVADVLAGRGGWPPAYVLYPGPNAVDLAHERPTGPITLVVLDGTWWQAKKLLRRNPAVAALPQLRLAPAAPSRYRIRREPHDHCVATIEALAMALRALEGEPGQPDDDARWEGLLAPFEAMVEHQLAFATGVRDARHLRAAIARGPRAPRPARAPVLEALRVAAERVVCVHGEANAWPVRIADRPPPEIVQWLAWRPATGERFQAIVKPRSRLAPSAPLQLGLDAAAFEAGETWASFRARWEAFAREDDVLCAWGHFPVDTLAREEIRVPGARVDARAAANVLLRARHGMPEDCATRLEEAGFGAAADPPAALAPGRGGRRMAALERVVAALLVATQAGGSPASP